MEVYPTLPINCHAITFAIPVFGTTAGTFHNKLLEYGLNFLILVC